MQTLYPIAAATRLLKRFLRRHTGYWQALVEFLALGTGLFYALYALAPVIGTPWTGALNYLSFTVYALAAWRLAPGHGSPARRLARLLSWGVLLGLLGGSLGYLSVRLLPLSESFLGYRITDERIAPGQFLFGAVLLVLAPFLLARALLALWRLGRVHLRWRLTYSYLLVAVLMLLLIAPLQGLFLGIRSLAIVPPLAAPAVAGQRAAVLLRPLVLQGATAQEMAAVLRAVVENRAYLPLTGGVASGETAPFVGVRRLRLLRPDGSLMADSNSAGGAGAPESRAALGGQPATEAAELAPLLAQIRDGGCLEARPATGPQADRAACAILGATGRPVAYLLIESNLDSATQYSAAINRVVTLTLATTVSNAYLLLLGLAAFLLLAGAAGYLLTRPITRRLERLAAATDDLAAGNLGVRVEVETADELGRLNAGFNAMAGRLQEREAALTTEKERVEQLLQANRRLVTDVSHELRTPLATLRGYLEVLEENYRHQLPAQDLEVIRAETDRLTRLIDDLFTLARTEAGQLPLHLELVNPAEVCCRLVQTLAPIARRERQLEVVAALAPQLPAIRADKARLEQMLLNLLQNALRYTPPGGLVALEGESAGGIVTLAVSDTGVGIPQEELDRVFDRFYRSDSSRARESGGAGVGLALVSELAAAMGASLGAESMPGRGSRFSISFPPAS